MLEFIYKYGDSSSFKVVRWDKNAQIQELKNSNEFHAKLAEAFDFAFSNDYGQGSGGFPFFMPLGKPYAKLRK